MAIAGLVIGLGNPGREYEATRHNTGFFFLDALLHEAHNVSVQSGVKFSCQLWKGKFSGAVGQWLLAKPQTFMNLSGESVQRIAAWYRIPPERILIIHDELDIELGRMKLKKGGGSAGHNGLKSIIQCLGTTDFYRLRIGIGHSPHGKEDTINRVLGRFSNEEWEMLLQLIPTAIEAVQLYIREEIEAATCTANGFRIIPSASS